MPTHEFKLHSPHSPEECEKRLTAVIDSSMIMGVRAVVGRVKGGSIRLRERTNYRNAFQTFLTARMRAHEGGTLIEGSLGLSLGLRIFLRLWFSFLILAAFAMGAISLRNIILNPSHGWHAWLGVFLPVAFAILAIYIFKHRKSLGRQGGIQLVSFMARTVDAKEVEEARRQTPDI